MNSYFLNISEEEKKSIKEKHTKLYDGYVTREGKGPSETPLTIGDYALDTEGVTVNNKGDVTEYRNTNINKKLKKTCDECGGLYEGAMCEQCSSMKEGEQCEQCGGEMREGEQCEQCATKSYTMEEIEENVKLKSKAPLVSEQIQESLKWFKKII